MRIAYDMYIIIIIIMQAACRQSRNARCMQQNATQPTTLLCWLLTSVAHGIAAAQIACASLPALRPIGMVPHANCV